MALDLGLTTHQLLSAMDGVVDDAVTRGSRLDDTTLASIPASGAPFSPVGLTSAGARGHYNCHRSRPYRAGSPHCQVNAMTYARNTTVSAMRTRNDIEETLERYGADGFAYATQGNLATVIFAMENRRIRFVLELPDPENFRYTNHSPPRERSDRAQREAYDQACRQRWRALLLVIKAKLEAVTAGISTIETEFLANIVLPDNTTAGEWMLPQIDRAYRTGEMPPLLPAGGSDTRSTGPIPLPPA